MEKVRNIASTLRALHPDVLQAPKIKNEVQELYDILPKIVVGGDQNVGKSSLLNKLMPPCLHGQVRLPTSEGTCTRSVTTIQFLYDAEMKVTLTQGGEVTNFDWSSGVDSLSQQLSHQLQRFQQQESNRQGFFKYETLVEIRHPEITMNYALMDMPGLRNADVHSQQIEMELKKLVGCCDMFLAVGKAEDDPDTITVLRNLNKKAKNICVLTKADGITNPAAMPLRIQKLDQNSNIFRWAITSATFENPYDEMECLARKLKQMHKSPKMIIGTDKLREEIESFYQQLVENQLPKALDIAHRLINSLRESTDKMEKSIERQPPSELVASSWHDIVQPLCLGKRNQLQQIATEAQFSIENQFPDNWLTKLLDNTGNSSLLSTVLSMRNENEGRVRGTEGIYEHLQETYKRIGWALVDHCTKELEVHQNKMKDATIAALRSEIALSPRYAKILQNYCQCISAVKEDPKKKLREALVYPPHSKNAYAHNAAARAVHHDLGIAIQSVAEETELNETKLNELRNSLSQISQNLARLGAIDNSVMKYNVESCVKWYWNDTYHALLVITQKRMISDFQKLIGDALRLCQVDMSNRPKEFIVEIDPNIQITVDKLKGALGELERVAGRPTRRYISPEPPQPRVPDRDMQMSTLVLF